MASVNTNAAAITALRTLQQTNASLDKTQNKISTGYKIGEAKDNAAYWAISVSLKSDNKSLSTVKDALGLGSSTVDVAYQGLNKAKDVLDEIKSKLTAATQDGLDRNTIQNEISQLQDQLKSIASSSVFSGENWLSVDSSVNGFNAEKQVVASFSRDASGSVSIGTIKVDTSSVALFDASSAATAGGILDTTATLKDSVGRDLTYGGTVTTSGNGNAGGVVAKTVTGALADTDTEGGDQVVAVVAGAGTNASTPSSKVPVTIGNADSFNVNNLKVGDTVSFKVNLNNTVTTQTMTFTGAGGLTTGNNFNTAGNLASNLQTSLGTAFGVTMDVQIATGVMTVQLGTGAASQSLSVQDVVISDKYGAVRNDRGFIANIGSGTATNFYAATAGTLTTISATALQTNGFKDTDQINFDMTINGQSLKVSVTPTGGTEAAIRSSLAASLNGDSAFNKVATASIAGGKLVITAASGNAVINSVSFADKDGKGKVMASTGFSNTAGKAVAVSDAFSGVITLDNDDNISFDVTLNGATSPTVVRIDKALVDKALPSNGGQIKTVGEYATVMTAALAKAGVSGVTVDTNAGALRFTTDAAGTSAKIVMTAGTASQGGAKMSVEKIDISSDALTAAGATTSDKIKDVLKAYITVVNSAIEKVKDAAASLGSVASRIDMQKSFVDNLMDTIEKGVGNLIDADMSEESTKLQALQVKQQLGVQALSIANQASQSILSLFRS